MDFNSTATFTKARIDVNYKLAWQAEPIALAYWQIQTPQRKARYSDKQRIRLKDAKSWALSRSGCENAAEVKKYLKILGIKLDLRLTSAWVAINKEFALALKILCSRQKEKHPGKVEKIEDAKDCKVKVSLISERLSWPQFKFRRAGGRSWLPLNNLPDLGLLAPLSPLIKGDLELE